MQRQSGDVTWTQFDVCPLKVNGIGRFLISVSPIIRCYEVFSDFPHLFEVFQQGGGSDVEEERFLNIYIVPKLNTFSQYVNNLVTSKAVYENALGYTSILLFFFSHLTYQPRSLWLFGHRLTLRPRCVTLSGSCTRIPCIFFAQTILLFC